MGSHWNNRRLFQLVWPLVIEQILAVSIGFVDTLMVTAVGESAVSGVSLVGAIDILIITIFSALASGGAVVASQYLGRKEPGNACLAAGQLMYTVLFISLLTMVTTLFLHRWLLRLVYGHIAPGVMASAQTYFFISAFTYPFIVLYNCCAALFRSMGKSKVCMLVAFLVNLLNIGGNALFIFGFGMGVAGAALSTLISRMLAGLVLLWLFTRPGQGPIHLRGLLRVRLVLPMVRRILRVGVPSGLENSMFQVGKLLTARIISTFGTPAIAGNAVAIALGTFCTLPTFAFGLAMITVVGQCVGAGDYTAARQSTKKLLAGGWVVQAVFCLVIGGARLPLLGLFNLSPQAVQLASRCLLTFCVMAPLFWPPSFALPNALRAAGDARYNMLVSMFSMWTFRIGCSFLFSYTLGYGMVGVWYAMVIDWVVRGTCFSLRWLGGKWQTKRVI